MASDPLVGHALCDDDVLFADEPVPVEWSREDPRKEQLDLLPNLLLWICANCTDHSPRHPSVFHANFDTIPISLQSYVNRLDKYLAMEDGVVLMATANLLRIQNVRPGYVNKDSIYKLFGVSVHISNKVMCDTEWSNACQFAADAVGVPVDQLKEMESTFLCDAIDWKVHYNASEISNINVMLEQMSFLNNLLTRITNK